MPASFLVDRLIIEAVKRGDLRIEDPGGRKLIDPADGKPARDSGLDAHGYILHARRLCSWRKGRDKGWIDLKATGKFVLHPKELVLIETYERLSLSPNICATIHALARLTLLGLSHISTTVHPGWGKDGPQPLRIALSNHGDLHFEIQDKEPLARILFYESETNAEINAPTPDEVFQRAENALNKHEAAAATQERLMRWTYIVVFTALLLIILSLLSDGLSVTEILFKGAAMTLIGLWAALIFRKMTD